MRAHHVDVAKALCIILVVMGHSGLAHRYPELNSALMTFRMPLFFMLAGIFFKADEAPLSVLKSKSASLLKPYLSFALLYAPYYLIKDAPQDLSAYLLGTFSFTGKLMPGWMFPMWFLTTLWALHMLASLFSHLTGFQQWPANKQFLLIALLLSGGQISIDWLWMKPLTIAGYSVQLQGLPFNIELWPITAAFFLMGYVLRQEIKNKPPTVLQTLLAAAIFSACHALHHPRLNLFEHIYSDIITTTIAAISGAITVIGVAAMIARVQMPRRALTSIGKVNLYILMFHAPLLSVLSKQMHQWLDSDLLALWLACLSSIGASLAIARLIRSSPIMLMLFEHTHRPAPTPATTTMSAGANAAIR